LKSALLHVVNEEWIERYCLHCCWGKFCLYETRSFVPITLHSNNLLRYLSVKKFSKRIIQHDVDVIQYQWQESILYYPSFSSPANSSYPSGRWLQPTRRI